MIGKLLTGVLMLYLMATLSVDAKAASARLFSSIGLQGNPDKAQIESKSAAIRERQKTKKFGHFKGDIRALEATEVVLDLPDGTTVTLARKYLRSHPTHLEWYGADEQKAIHLTLTAIGHHLSGILRTADARFSIDQVGGDGIYLIADMEQTRAQRDHSDRPYNPPPASDIEKFEKEYQDKLKRDREKSGNKGGAIDPTGIQALAGSTVIDIMVGYTDKATTYFAGGSSKLISNIIDAIGEANASFSASGVAITLNLKTYPKIGLVEGNYSTIEGLRDAYFYSDEARTKRNSSNSDVALLVFYPFTGYCGAAIQGPSSGGAFGVVNAACLREGLSLPHEFGHLMGADHDIGNPISPPRSEAGIAHGFPGRGDKVVRTYPNDLSLYGLCRHTIMAYPRDYAGCTSFRIAYWSNPSIKYVVPDYYRSTFYLGSTNANDAAWLNQNAVAVSNFRVGSGSPGGGGISVEAAATQQVLQISLLTSTNY